MKISGALKVHSQNFLMLEQNEKRRYLIKVPSAKIREENQAYHKYRR